MEASLKFYVDGLGFAMQHSWIPDRDGYHIEFESPADALEESEFAE